MSARMPADALAQQQAAYRAASLLFSEICQVAQALRAVLDRATDAKDEGYLVEAARHLTNRLGSVADQGHKVFGGHYVVGLPDDWFGTRALEEALAAVQRDEAGGTATTSGSQS